MPGKAPNRRKIWRKSRANFLGTSQRLGAKERQNPRIGAFKKLQTCGILLVEGRTKVRGLGAGAILFACKQSQLRPRRKGRASDGGVTGEARLSSGVSIHGPKVAVVHHRGVRKYRSRSDRQAARGNTGECVGVSDRRARRGNRFGRRTMRCGGPAAALPLRLSTPVEARCHRTGRLRWQRDSPGEPHPGCPGGRDRRADAP